MNQSEKEVMDMAMRKAIDLLTLAEKLSRPFDPFERYWREMVLEEDMGGTSELVMRAASRFATLGPAVYLRYQNVQDVLEGIDEALKFVSEMYCSLCTSSVSREDLYPTSRADDVSSEDEMSNPFEMDALSREDDVSSLSVSTRSEGAFEDSVVGSSLVVESNEEYDDEIEPTRPELTVRVLRGRSLYRQGKRDEAVNVYVTVEVAGEMKSTDTAPAGSNDPVWDDEGDTISELSFDGGDEGLDPHTVVRVSVYHRRTILSDVFIGQWSEKIVNLASHSARKPAWYPLGWHPNGGSLTSSAASLYGFGDLQLAFNVKGLAMLLKGYHSDLPATCGLSSAVSGLIEGVQSQLPKIRHLISIHEEKISCAVQSVVSSSYAPAVGCVVPSTQRIRPHLTSDDDSANSFFGKVKAKDEDEEERDTDVKHEDDDEIRLGPMVFPLEGQLRSDVIGGIYDPDMKDEGSVGTFEEASRHQHDIEGKNGKFYQGYEYFATVLRKMDGLN